MNKTILCAIFINALTIFPCVILMTCAPTPALLKTMQPYSISPQFDLSRTWRIAVLPVAGGANSDTGTNQRLVEHAEMQLMKVVNLSVVDRSTVAAILKEQEFSYSGVVDPQTAARLGKLMGASAVMTIRINQVKHDPFFSDSPEQRDASLTVRIINVETGELFYSAQGEGSSFYGAESALTAALDVALLPLLQQGGVK